MPRETEARVLGLALRAVASMEEESWEDFFGQLGQGLYKTTQQALEMLLLGLLEEDLTSDHLFSLLDHLRVWRHSSEGAVRAWAMRMASLLVRHAVHLAQFQITDEAPLLGHYVAKLGIQISDAQKEVSREARHGLYHLHQLALQQKGINISQAPDIWRRELELDEWTASYFSTMYLGKIFAELMSAEQKKVFLDTALQAVQDPAPHISWGWTKIRTPPPRKTTVNSC